MSASWKHVEHRKELGVGNSTGGSLYLWNSYLETITRKASMIPCQNPTCQKYHAYWGQQVSVPGLVRKRKWFVLWRVAKTCEWIKAVLVRNKRRCLIEGEKCIVDTSRPFSLIPCGSSQWKPKGQSSRSVVRSNHTHLCEYKFKGHIHIQYLSCESSAR